MGFSDGWLASGIFAEQDWFGRAGGGLSSGRDWLGATEILPLQDDVGEEQGEGNAGPDDGFVGGVAEGVPAGDAADHADFQKDDRNGEAASHPLAVLLDFSFQDEHESDGGGGHPERSVSGRGEAEAARGTHALFVILDVGAERGGDEDAGDVDAADDAMEAGVTLTKAIGELHRAEDQGAGAGEGVGQEPPLEGLDMGPFGIFGVEEKAFVVAKNVDDHEADEDEEKVFRTGPGKTGKHAYLFQSFSPLWKPGEAGDGAPTAHVFGRA